MPQVTDVRQGTPGWLEARKGKITASLAAACSYPDCGKPVKIKKSGLCSAHNQQRLAGKELRPLYKNQRVRGTSPLTRCVESPCNVPGLDGPCQIFTGHKNHHGYGVASVGRKLMLVHRYAWEKANGPVPKEMFLDHRCRARSCANPGHLRLVTRIQNTLENSLSIPAKFLERTHCANGHEFNEANTRKYRGYRICRACEKNKRKRRRDATNYDKPGKR